ncbi:MAG: hypothetical protein V3R99_14165 [Thermoguttaceae bacterium]
MPTHVTFVGSRSGRKRRWPLGGSVVAAVALLMILSPAANGADDPGRGGDPYIPSQAEWLCLTLNVDDAVNAIYRSAGDIAIRYVWDESRPDTVEIFLSYPSKLVGPRAVEVRAEQAKSRLLEAAGRRGWRSWLKMEVRVIED